LDTKILTVADILAAVDVGETLVDVPEWGGTVKVKGLTKKEQQQLRKQATDPLTGQMDADKLEIFMLAHCLAEPAITVEQAEQLANKSAAAFDRVLMAIMDVAGLSPEVQKQTMKSFRAGS